MVKDNDEKDKYTCWEKAAIILIIILIIIIILLIFNEKVKEYLEIFKAWYQKG